MRGEHTIHPDYRQLTPGWAYDPTMLCSGYQPDTIRGYVLDCGPRRAVQLSGVIQPSQLDPGETAQRIYRILQAQGASMREIQSALATSATQGWR